MNSKVKNIEPAPELSTGLKALAASLGGQTAAGVAASVSSNAFDTHDAGHLDKLRKVMGHKGELSVQHPAHKLSSGAITKELASKHGLGGKDILLGGRNIALDAHELGHLTGGRYANKPMVSGVFANSLLAASGLVAAPAASFAYANAARNALKVRRGQALTVEDKAQEYIPAAGIAALSTPRLLEEARASIRGIKGISRVYGRGAALKAVVPLATAFGSYAVPSAVPLVARSAGKSLGENMQTKTASNDLTRLTLEKLGAAWYIHKAKINASNDAAKAVDYLKSKGVLH